MRVVVADLGRQVGLEPKTKLGAECHVLRAVAKSIGNLLVIAKSGAFWEQLHRQGEIIGRNLSVERYSGEGHPESYADLARAVVSRNPDLIVAATDVMAQVVRPAGGAVIQYDGGRAGCHRLVSFDQDFARLVDPAEVTLLGSQLTG